MKPITRIASLVFAIVGILHLTRVIFNIDLLIGGVEIPLWVSVFGFVVPAFLSVGLWKESK